MFPLNNSTCDMKQPYYAAPTILNLRPRLDLGLPASFIHSWSKDGCSVIISSFIFIILSCRAPKVEKTLYIYGQFGKNLLPWHFSNCQVEVSPFSGHQIKESEIGTYVTWFCPFEPIRSILTCTVLSQFKKAWFKKESWFKNNCSYNRFFST